MKKRIIACVIACATLLMGTGFAYWTDLINIRATAETGYLDVNFKEAKYLGNNFVPTNAKLEESAYDTTARTAKVDENNPDLVTFDITDLYPGHYEAFQATAVNAGTVAAKLGKVTTSISGTNGVTLDMIGIALDAVSDYETTKTCRDFVCDSPFCTDSTHEHEYVTIFGQKFVTGRWVTVTKVIGHKDDVDINLPAGSTFKIGKQTFVRLSALTSVAVDEQLSNMLYLTNNSDMDFFVMIGMDPDASGTYTTGSAALGNPNHKVDAHSQNTTATVTLGLVWDQYNEQ